MGFFMSCPTLKRIPGLGVRGPVVIAIMDGVGLGRGDETDAVAQAKTPTLARIAEQSLRTKLAAHGRAVGMPSDEDMGNSEVGHNALGSGRIFDQGAKLVSAAIATGAIYEGPVWRDLVAHCKKAGSPLHFIGLLSDGNVHSNIAHLIALIERADSEGLAELFVHALLDGRDVPKSSALEYVDQLEAALAKITSKPGRNYRIASGGGRMVITMDRYESDWSMLERGWQTHVKGEGRQFASTREAIETYRAEHPGAIDQDLPAFVIAKGGKPVGPIREGAGVVAFNFRGDRMLELVRCFEDEQLDKFARGPRPNVFFAGMTLYDGDTHRPKRYLVAPPAITCTLGELLVHAGVRQFACSETQKYGHVTYFWNGNRTGTFSDQLERYVEVPSHAPPFDERPEMRAPEIAEAVLAALAENRYQLLRLNFANGDMVGHTGNFAATVKAVEAVDAALAKLVDPVLAAGGALIVTADHGNADDMAERDKKSGKILRDASGAMVPKTSHSLNPVPFYVLLAEKDRGRFEINPEAREPGLGNVASTLATLLGFEPPSLYLPSLIRPR
jgi:2,3-bisphosphoglycerate-independent phosphoglycerate mutase